jgi:uncharacterized SAM-binding protein YcdF (DUF218 family)
VEVVREFLSLLIGPIPVLYILLVVSLVFFGFKRKRTAKVFLIVAGLWFFIITTPFLPKIFVKSLESRYTQLSDSCIKTLPDSCNIIVLGSDNNDDNKLTPNNQLSLIAMSRLAEGIRIHRMIPGSRLILSGYGRRSKLPHALVLYRTAVILGVDPTMMAIQSSPSNTRKEAETYIKNFGTKRKIILVTSAIHMPRAVMNFQKSGVNPVAAPADFFLKYGSRRNPWEWLPYSENIAMMEQVIHESVGILWTKLGGR